jgi:hypothetical protein
MGPHRLRGGVRVASADGREQAAVLVHALAAPDGERSALLESVDQGRQGPRERPVPRRRRERAMEVGLRGDALVGASAPRSRRPRALHALDRRRQRVEVFVGPPLSGEPSGLRRHRAAALRHLAQQLVAIARLEHRRHDLGVEHVPLRRREHAGAAAVLDREHRPLLQGAHRLTHHAAAHAVLLGHRLLAREHPAGGRIAVEQPLEDPRHGVTMQPGHGGIQSGTSRKRQ